MYPVTTFVTLEVVGWLWNSNRLAVRIWIHFSQYVFQLFPACSLQESYFSSNACIDNLTRICAPDVMLARMTTSFLVVTTRKNRMQWWWTARELVTRGLFCIKVHEKGGHPWMFARAKMWLVRPLTVFFLEHFSLRTSYHDRDWSAICPSISISLWWTADSWRPQLEPLGRRFPTAWTAVRFDIIQRKRAPSKWWTPRWSCWAKQHTIMRTQTPA